MFGALGRIGIAIGIGFFVAREVERKMTQRRNDPVSYRETPVAYGAGAFAAVLAVAMISRKGELALVDGTCECRS